MRKEEALWMIERTISGSEKGFTVYIVATSLTKKRKKGRKYRSIDLSYWMNTQCCCTLFLILCVHTTNLSRIKSCVCSCAHARLLTHTNTFQLTHYSHHFPNINIKGNRKNRFLFLLEIVRSHIGREKMLLAETKLSLSNSIPYTIFTNESLI